MSQYANLSREELVARLEALEGAPNRTAEPPTFYATAAKRFETSNAIASSSKTTIPSSNVSASPNKALKGPKVPKPRKQPKEFHFASHPTRHIALLLSYTGWGYSGLAIQSDAATANASEEIKTVEGELLKALGKTRLIHEGRGLEGAGYGRCGRTDRGVSGWGQVVDLWVRSARRSSEKEEILGWREAEEPPAQEDVTQMEQDDPGSTRKQSTPPSSGLSELPYPRLLNGVLPPSIRVLAWSPIGPDFSSRFSCSFRHYKYAFHLRPTPTSRPLDIDLMREAAQLLLGEHDFRNYCRLDGAKQIENHSRRVLKAYFERADHSSLDGENLPLYVFNLVGTAFLWHQVRHIIAILFLIGSHLEPVTLVTDLLDVERAPGKPAYQMGDPLPLTLYECGYEQGSGLAWRYGSYDAPLPAGGRDSGISSADMGYDGLETLARSLESARQEAEITAWQTGGALQTLERIYGDHASLGFSPAPPNGGGVSGGKEGSLVIHPVGGGDLVMTTKYKAVMSRPMGETPDAVNRKWRERGGMERRAAKRDAKAGMEDPGE